MAGARSEETAFDKAELSGPEQTAHLWGERGRAPWNEQTRQAPCAVK